ncbi:MAG: hypothetical protein RLY31_1560 [Bacteroidota bacterium]|jgi:beta-glucosidase
MDAMERQATSMPRDRDFHRDTAGHSYAIGFGSNWNGVIHKTRTERYRKHRPFLVS